MRKLVTEIQSLELAARALGDSPEQIRAREALNKIIEQKKAEHQKGIAEIRKHLLREEAATYHKMYQAVYEEIRRYALEKGIEVVLRSPVNGKPQSLLSSMDPADTDPTDSKAVLQQINQHVLFVQNAERENVDITDAILERLKPR